MSRNLASVLQSLTVEPGRPRLTWYGPDGERVELSGAVLVNWVTKTTNLLVEEFDAAPGTTIHLDLPPHWRTLVWALAGWRCGASLSVPGPGSPAAVDVLVTSRPTAAGPTHQDLVVVSLPALARSYDGALPAGAIDAAAAVMTYGDRLGYVPPTDQGAPALSAAVTVTHGELVDRADSGLVTRTPTPRLLVPTGDGPGTVPALLSVALGAWALDGSVVVLAPAVAAELAADPVRRARLVATERIDGESGAAHGEGAGAGSGRL